MPIRPENRKLRFGNAHKYHAVRTEVDGISFASKAEARRYSELRLLERGGEIEHLELQPRFPIIVKGQKVSVYVADFRYRDARTNSVVVEDVKGVRTALFALKAKLVKALYGIEISEVRA